MNSRLAWQAAGLLAWGVRKLRPHPVEPPPRPQPMVRGSATIMTPVAVSEFVPPVLDQDEWDLIELAAHQAHRGENALAEMNRTRAGYGGLSGNP